MYSTLTFGAIGAAAAGIFFTVGSTIFSQPFLIVNDLSVTDGVVFADRTYTRRQEVIADWSVVVVPERQEAPACHTIHGQKLHEGWSKYPSDTRVESVMSVDVWVNDPGCYARLQSGTHDMFVTWTPRDGSAPVTITLSWAVSKD